MAQLGKTRIRRRDVRKAIIITAYAFVAIVTVIGLVSPALQ